MKKSVFISTHFDTIRLKKLDQFVEKRCDIARRYDKAFENNQLLITPNRTDTVNHAYHLYPLQLDFKKLAVKKSEFFKIMKKRNISLQVHYIPVHMQSFYSKKYGFQKNDFPNAFKFYEREISLPIYPKLEIEAQEYVINSLINSS